MSDNITPYSADSFLHFVTSLLEAPSESSSEDSNQSDSTSERLELDLTDSVPPQIPYPIHRIFVRNDEVAPILQQELIDTLHAPFHIELDNVFWPRDNRVILPDGTHLIPGSLTDHSDFFHLLLPEQFAHFKNQAFDGRGLSFESREQAINKAAELNLTYKKSQVAIEGGNCFVFLSSQGEKKAIIGYNSVLLSLIRLEKSHYFSNPSLPKRIFPKKEFSEDDLRIAKNYTLYTSKRPNLSQKHLLRQANKLDWMFDHTIKKIAKELGVSEHRIAIIGQESFHIDMEIFVGPEDPERPGHHLVFLHDEEKILQIQHEIGFHNVPILVRTKEYSEERLESSRQRLEKNIQILKNIGCTPVCVPGILSALYLKNESIYFPYIKDYWMEKECDIITAIDTQVFSNTRQLNDFEVFTQNDHVALFNFMNGLFIKGNPDTFLVPSPRSHPIVKKFQEAFCEAVQGACPQLQVKFIYQDLLTDTLLRYNGSIHCLTNYYQ